jgi:hypothetical protein
MTRRAPPMDDLFGPRPDFAENAVERASLVDLELRRLPARDSDKAFCVQKTATSTPVYLPKSLAELHEGEFTMPRWLAVEKDLL